VNAVRTCLTVSDVSRAVVERLTRPGSLLKAWAGWTLVVAALLVVARGVPRDAIGALSLAIAAAAGAVLSVGLAIAFTVLRVRRGLQPAAGVLGAHDYVLANDGLQEKTAVNATLSAWSAIGGVAETRNFAFIEMRSGSFHILPRHSFGTAAQAAEFLDEVRRRAAGH
jgi:hypothetical protein